MRTDLKLSFEFFPPKSKAAGETLWASIEKLTPLNPEFVSVTYGAGGTTRTRTHDTVARIASNTSMRPAAHLTCVGASKDDVNAVAQGYWDAGVRHIVALRGDPEEGVGETFIPRPDGYAYASDLVAGLKAVAPFEISVGVCPEGHPESANWCEDIDNLKRKIDAGATRAITQFFFSPDTFLRFQDQVRTAGIDIPLIPGVMLQPNYKGLSRMSKMCGIDMPEWYHELFEGLDDDPQTRRLLAASTAAELTNHLFDRGVRHFHLYTLNKADLAFSLCKLLGVHAQQKQKVIS